MYLSPCENQLLGSDKRAVNCASIRCSFRALLLNPISSHACKHVSAHGDEEDEALWEDVWLCNI